MFSCYHWLCVSFLLLNVRSRCFRSHAIVWPALLVLPQTRMESSCTLRKMKMTAQASPTVLKHSFSGNLTHWFSKQMEFYCSKVQGSDFAKPMFFNIMNSMILKYPPMSPTLCLHNCLEKQIDNWKPLVPVICAFSLEFLGHYISPSCFDFLNCKIGIIILS